MLSRDYLNLLEVRLCDGEQWSPPRGCLTFIFAKDGAGQLGKPESLAGHGSGNGGPQVSLPWVVGTPGNAVILNTGDVLVVYGPAHGTISRHASQTGFAFSAFSVCIEHLFPLLSGRDIALLEGVKEGFRAPRHFGALTPVAIQCHELLKDVPPPFEIDHRSQLLRAAASVIALEFKNARAAHRSRWKPEERMSQLLESLSVAEIMEGSVEDLARKFSCTARHLNRLFHQHFGCSVAALRMEMRLLKAASLLGDPDAKVILVASQCGFNYLGQFNSCFKRRFGMSPSQWRQARPGAAPDEKPLLEQNESCRARVLGLCPWTSLSSEKNGSGSEKTAS